MKRACELQQLLLQLLRALTHSHIDAQHRLYFSAFKDREALLRTTQVKGWIFSAMKSLFVNDYHRLCNNQVEQWNEELSTHTELPTTLLDEISTSSLSEINQAIEELPRSCGTTFKLFLAGYSCDEIAEIIGEPLATVKSHIHHARELLKKRLEESKEM